MRARKMLLTIAIVVVSAWLALSLLAYLFQDRLILMPGPRPGSTPRDAGLEFEPVTLTTGDGVRLDAWWIPAPKSTRNVLVCHGNAGSIEGRLDLARLFHANGWSTLLFDYRGFGASSGSPSAATLGLDAEAAYDWLAARASGAPIVAWGESLGGAVAADLATRRRIDALVLESAFTSLADIAAHAYPFLPARWLLRTRLDTLATLPRLDVPTLVLHGRRDEIVPLSHGQALFDASRGKKQFCEFPGGHNDRGWAQDAAILEEVRRFLGP